MRHYCNIAELSLTNKIPFSKPLSYLVESWSVVWFGSKRTRASERSLSGVCLGPLQHCVLKTRFPEWWLLVDVGVSFLALARWMHGMLMQFGFCHLHEIELVSIPNQGDRIFRRKNISHKIVCIGSSFIYL